MSYNKAKSAYEQWHDLINKNNKQKEVAEVNKKIVVSRETGDALDFAFSSLEKGYITKYRMIQACAQSIWGETVDILNKMSPETMLEILLNGYEVDLKPQHKIEQSAKKAHDSFAVVCNTSSDLYSYRSGMRDILAILGYSFNWLNISQDVASHTVVIDKPTKH